MKFLAPWTLVGLLGATPAEASIQIGPEQMPEKDYRSVRNCERALATMVKVETAKPQSLQRQARAEGGTLTVTTFVTPTTYWRTFRCRGSFLSEVRGHFFPSAEPLPPAKQ